MPKWAKTRKAHHNERGRAAMASGRVAKRRTLEAARDRALNTFEIVTGIITHIPKADITRLSGIARIWRNVIQETPSIRLRPAVVPVVLIAEYAEAMERGGARESWEVNNGQTAYYEQDLQRELYFDRHLRSDHEPHAYLIRMWQRVTLGKKDIVAGSPLREFSKRFATSPPIQALSIVLLSSPGQWDENQCVVYVKEGVKIGHVLDAAWGMYGAEIGFAWDLKVVFQVMTVR